MQCDETTSFYDFLMSGEKAWDRLVAHHPALARFSQVLLDEDRARRLDLGDLARMLDVDLAALLAVANGREAPSPLPAGDWPLPEIGKDADDRGTSSASLDVRPIFDTGHEPLGDILDHAEQLPAGEVLVVDAPFHPLPLRRLLGGRGFRSQAEPLGRDGWRVRFQRTAGSSQGPQMSEAAFPRSR